MTEGQREPGNPWETQMLRFTGFFDPPKQHPEQNWWEEITGTRPETRIQQLQAGIARIDGAAGIGRLLLNLTPDRVDWLLVPAPASDSELMSVGGFDDAFQLFREWMQGWLTRGGVAPMQRVAFGANLAQPTESSITGLRKLSPYLPRLEIDPEGSEDLFYQINRPRPSADTPNMRLNRISKWQVAQLAAVGVIVAPRPIVVPQPMPFPMAIILEVDVNTPDVSVPGKPREELPYPVTRLLLELMDLAREITREGDIP